jgi:hypothetical protein
VGKITPRFTGHPNFFVRGTHWFYRKAYEEPLRRLIRQRFLQRGVPWDSLAEDAGELHTLLCHRDVEMGLCAAMCYALAARSRFRWFVHDDGSLTSDDRERICASVPGAAVISRQASDERAAREYGHLAKILEYRRRQVMALKLVDVRIWAESDRIAYLDSDICFFRYPDFFLKALRGVSRGSYFNKDAKDAYVLDRLEIGRRLGVAPHQRVNAGLWVMNRNDIDLDVIERWLNDPSIKECLYAYTLDQTFISMLAVLGADGVDHLPPEYDVDLAKPVATCVSKHYVGAIRHGFELEGLRAMMASHVAG